MTKRKNPFVRIKQYFYEDGDDICCWVDEDFVDEFLSIHSDWLEPDETGNIPLKCTEERILNGKAYNEWIIGNTYGDYEGIYVDEDCPECEHLLILPECYDDILPVNARFCSSCDYENKEFKEYIKERDARWKRDDKPLPRIKEVGQTLDEFIEKYGFVRFEKEIECVVCNRVVPVSDYYRSGGYAIISYEHDNCTNGGPCVAIPQGKEAKRWGEILG